MELEGRRGRGYLWNWKKEGTGGINGTERERKRAISGTERRKGGGYLRNWKEKGKGAIYGTERDRMEGAFSETERERKGLFI